MFSVIVKILRVSINYYIHVCPAGMHTYLSWVWEVLIRIRRSLLEAGNGEEIQISTEQRVPILRKLSKMTCLKVVYNENQGGSARLRLLRSGLGLVRSKFFFPLNMPFSCKNCISVSAQYWLNNRIFLTIGNSHRTGTSHLQCSFLYWRTKGSSVNRRCARTKINWNYLRREFRSALSFHSFFLLVRALRSWQDIFKKKIFNLSVSSKI